MITGKSDLPKCRTTSQYIGWSQMSHKHRARAVITWKAINIAMISTNQHRGYESSDAFPARNPWEMFKVDPFPCTHLLLSAAAVAKHLQYDHLNTVDCRFVGISLIVCCTVAPNSTNSIPHVRKSHANLPKRDIKREKLLRCPVKVVLKRSRSRSTFHFSKSPRSFIQYRQILCVLC